MECFSRSLVRSGFGMALGLALAVLNGCTGSSQPLGKPVPVKGTVTYKGAPAPAGCIITFIHAERNFPASASIAADGTYTLMFNGKPEVPEGTYKVSVTLPVAETTVNSSDPEAYKAMMMKPGISQGGGPAKVATIPKKYASPETSGVTFTVMEGQTTYDLEMKD